MGEARAERSSLPSRSDIRPTRERRTLNPSFSHGFYQDCSIALRERRALNPNFSHGFYQNCSITLNVSFVKSVKCT